MRGSATSEAKVLEFRAAYIEHKNVSAAARAVGLPTSTAFDLVDEAEADPEFVRARERIRARVMPQLEDRLLDMAETIHARINSPDPTPKELAAIAVEHELKSFSYQNPKPQYFKGFVDLYKAVGGTRKGESGPIDMGPAVVVNLTVESPPPKPDIDGA
jgi:hypothetical protein